MVAGRRATAVEADQAADSLAAAADCPSGIAPEDAAVVVTGEAAGARTPGARRHVAGRVAVLDGAAGVVPSDEAAHGRTAGGCSGDRDGRPATGNATRGFACQSAAIIIGRDRAGRGGIADSPPRQTDQDADARRPSDSCGLQADIAQRSSGSGISEKSDMVSRRQVDRQIRDHTALAVEASRELVGIIADRREAARRPHAGILAAHGKAARKINVGCELVARTEVHRHQLKLMRVCDIGRIFPLAEWAGPAIDREPAGRGIAGGKIEIAIGALLERIVCCRRLRRIAGHFSQADRPRSPLPIPAACPVV